MAQTIRFGIVGGGLMGREFASAAARWLALLDHPAKPEIVHVADPSPAARAWFAQSLGCRTSEDHRTLLEDKEVEAVYAAVPHHLHETVYLDVLRAGKHLFAEKPFGIDLPAAERIVAEIDQRPGQLVRVSSEFPFFPAAQRLAGLDFGRILEVHAAFNHSSDLDPNKPINWKRQIATNGAYGCMGDLGLHVLHLPLRLGWRPRDVRGLLTKAVETRPDGSGGTAPCETWDNATLACRSTEGFPMILETRRISPGDANTWTIRVLGTQNSAEFSTKRPKTLRTLPYAPGETQAWREEDWAMGLPGPPSPAPFSSSDSPTPSSRCGPPTAPSWSASSRPSVAPPPRRPSPATASSPLPWRASVRARRSAWSSVGEEGGHGASPVHLRDVARRASLRVAGQSLGPRVD